MTFFFNNSTEQFSSLTGVIAMLRMSYGVSPEATRMWWPHPSVHHSAQEASLLYVALPYTFSLMNIHYETWSTGRWSQLYLNSSERSHCHDVPGYWLALSFPIHLCRHSQEPIRFAVVFRAVSCWSRVVIMLLSLLKRSARRVIMLSTTSYLYTAATMKTSQRSPHYEGCILCYPGYLCEDLCLGVDNVRSCTRWRARRHPSLNGRIRIQQHIYEFNNFISEGHNVQYLLPSQVSCSQQCRSKNWRQSNISFKHHNHTRYM